MAIDKASITTRGGVLALLKDRPREWAVVLASRAALRVLPLTFRARDKSPTPDAKLMLAAIRANFVAWTAAYSKDYTQALRNAAAYAAADAYAAAAAAAYAAAAAADATAADAAADAAYAAAYAAATAADDAADAAAAAIWEVVNADVDWLLSHESEGAAGLNNQPLWLIDVKQNPRYVANFPPWARTPFDVFKRSEWAKRGPWGVWLAWYLELLPDPYGPVRPERFNAEAAFKIASMDDSFWTADPHAVTEKVADLVGWKWDKSKWKRPASAAAQPKKRSKASPRKSERTEQVNSPPPPPPIEAVRVHSDEATADDQLGRKIFAQALVEHMDDVCARQFVDGRKPSADRDGYAMHIYAPWGSGKTSVIKMMRAMLEQKERHFNNGSPAPTWVVVYFNAWTNERRNPPWWPLMEAIKSACLSRLERSEVFEALRLKRYWFWWKASADWLPYVVATLVVAVSGIIVWSTWGSNSESAVETILKLAAALTAVVASFVTASRFAVFGSAGNAKLYEDLSQDPMKRLTALFEKIVAIAGQPICIVIDDLDRCRPDYVVALLQGLQTIFRHGGVAYVVAADRNWIKTSFESQYSALKDSIGNPAQPLGYLFLEKLFQVSTPLPGVRTDTRKAYWKSLLLGAAKSVAAEVPSSQPVQLTEAAVEQKRAEIRARTSNFTSAAADAWLEQSDTPEDRAAVALEIASSPAVEREAAHLLERFGDVVPQIPRVMKRMINAYAIRRSTGYLTDNRVSIEALVRWTILEQGYPALTDLLIDNPVLADAIATGNADAWKDVEDGAMQKVLGSPEVKSIIAGNQGAPLTSADVRTLTRGGGETEAVHLEK